MLWTQERAVVLHGSEHKRSTPQPFTDGSHADHFICVCFAHPRSQPGSLRRGDPQRVARRRPRENLPASQFIPNPWYVQDHEHEADPQEGSSNLQLREMSMKSLATRSSHMESASPPTQHTSLTIALASLLHQDAALSTPKVRVIWVGRFCNVASASLWDRSARASAHSLWS